MISKAILYTTCIPITRQVRNGQSFFKQIVPNMQSLFPIINHLSFEEVDGNRTKKYKNQCCGQTFNGIADITLEDGPIQCVSIVSESHAVWDFFMKSSQCMKCRTQWL